MEIQKKQVDLKILQQRSCQALESLKLQEETQRGLDASLRNEAAAYHSLSTRIPKIRLHGIQKDSINA